MICMHPSVKKEQKINMQLTDPHKEPCLLEQDNVPFVQIVMKCLCICSISYMLCFFISVREKAWTKKCIPWDNMLLHWMNKEELQMELTVPLMPVPASQWGYGLVTPASDPGTYANNRDGPRTSRDGGFSSSQSFLCDKWSPWSPVIVSTQSPEGSREARTLFTPQVNHTQRVTSGHGAAATLSTQKQLSVVVVLTKCIFFQLVVRMRYLCKYSVLILHFVVLIADWGVMCFFFFFFKKGHITHLQFTSVKALQSNVCVLFTWKRHLDVWAHPVSCCVY